MSSNRCSVKYRSGLGGFLCCTATCDSFLRANFAQRAHGVPFHKQWQNPRTWSEDHYVIYKNYLEYRSNNGSNSIQGEFIPTQINLQRIKASGQNTEGEFTIYLLYSEDNEFATQKLIFELSLINIITVTEHQRYFC